MTLYTVVDDGYDVDVYRSLKAVCAAMANQYCLEPADDSDEEPRPASVRDIARAIKADPIVRLYPIEGGDWTYRIQKH
ncbi:hypothetical protein [Dickeya sp. NCPPB 3274]|uniref:hypothetical protein n=1 Tax=Dickeya sp. NCPPB 3274 TaxID=568766 RepID=UPI001268B623|nr:hypothetical protein [Dickeya sp. NCPPB 3274]